MRRRAEEEAKRSGQPRQPAKQEPQVNIVADARHNILVVHAPPDKMAIIEQAIKAIDIPVGTDHTLLATMTRMQIYRLAAIDPEALVKTLEEVGGLDPRTRLEVDKTNRAIIAYAPLADHALIRQLIEKLDGSSRRFEVIQLRRLPADYVAGTIEFMMGGREEQTGQVRRYYYYGPAPRRSEETPADRFRVDADVENNRLLLWANDIEIQEVTNLLVKLGEIPPEGERRSNVRLLDATWEDDVEAWLERVRRAWPSVAPNPLVTPPGGLGEPQNEQPTESSQPATQSGQPTARQEARPSQPLRSAKNAGLLAGPTSPRWAAPIPAQPSRRSGEPVVHLAQLARGAEQAVRTDAGRPHSPAASEHSSQPSGTQAHMGTTNSVAPPSGTNASAEPSGVPSQDSRAPVYISRAPDGRLVISSEDTRALDLFAELMQQMAPPRADYKIFRLKYAWASGVALTLEEVFKEEEEQRRPRYPYWYYYDYDYYYSRSDQRNEGNRLSRRKPVKFIADPDTNSILVQNATPKQLAKIEKLIEFYDQPEPPDSQSVRSTRIFSLRYAKAADVAEAIKDIYRDLLSPNDKALMQARQRQSSRSYTFVYSSGSSERSLGSAPRFKGLLSVGVNEASNTLLVNAPAQLMEEVSQLIEQLDEMARPAVETISVVQLDGVSAGEVERQLARILGQQQPSRRPASRQRPAEAAGRRTTRTPSRRP